MLPPVLVLCLKARLRGTHACDSAQCFAASSLECALRALGRTITATSASASCGLAAGLSLAGSSFASALAWWAITRTASASGQHAQPVAMSARRQAHEPAEASRQLSALLSLRVAGRPPAATAMVSALQGLPVPSAGSARWQGEYKDPPAFPEAGLSTSDSGRGLRRPTRGPSQR